tara:strand:+ start:1899 stop:2261 length:363 start_codon:yes stop_codon:yes gene_type:complete
MDNNKNEPTDKVKQTDEVSEAAVNAKQNEDTPVKKIKKQATEKQLSNPFHGVKLVQILESVVAHYGWPYLADRVKIRCFIYNPTMKSSLGFLRKTQWAREFVEDIYLDMLDEKKAKEKKD